MTLRFLSLPVFFGSTLVSAKSILNGRRTSLLPSTPSASYGGDGELQLLERANEKSGTLAQYEESASPPAPHVFRQEIDQKDVHGVNTIGKHCEYEPESSWNREGDSGTTSSGRGGSENIEVVQGSSPLLCTVGGYAVDKNNVQRSSVMSGDDLFDVAVRLVYKSTTSAWLSSFVHKTTPGNGNGKYFRPTDQGQPYSGPDVDTCTPACSYFNIRQDCCNADGAHVDYIKDVTMNFVQVEFDGPKLFAGASPDSNANDDSSIARTSTSLHTAPTTSSSLELRVRRKNRTISKNITPRSLVDEVVIRPKAKSYDVRPDPEDENGVIISIAGTNSQQIQLSIEFADDIKYYYSNGREYVAKHSLNRYPQPHGWEPTNALLFFASPYMPSPIEELQLHQDEDDSKNHAQERGQQEVLVEGGANIFTMTPGIPLDSIELEKEPSFATAKTLYFPPGVYWMKYQGADHLKLGKATKRVHLDLGAYVKSTLEWTNVDESSTSSFTGHGILSGSEYVYQANPDCQGPMNPNDGGGCSDSSDSGLIEPTNPHRCKDQGQCYLGVKNDRTSLRMLWHRDPFLKNQKFEINGPIVASPPFNVHDFCWGGTCGSDQYLSLEVNDYKQVGAFFLQTDGLMPYAGSIQNSFLHVNDDGLKLYYPDLTAKNLIFWKAYNDPVVQFGWTPRQISNVSVEDLTVIHARFIRSEGSYLPSAIVGASPFYDGSHNVDVTKTFSASFKNIRCETGCPPLYDLHALQNIDLEFEHVWYDPENLDFFGNLKWVDDELTPWPHIFTTSPSNKLTTWNPNKNSVCTGRSSSSTLFKMIGARSWFVALAPCLGSWQSKRYAWEDLALHLPVVDEDDAEQQTSTASVASSPESLTVQVTLTGTLLKTSTSSHDST